MFKRFFITLQATAVLFIFVQTVLINAQLAAWAEAYNNLSKLTLQHESFLKSLYTRLNNIENYQRIEYR